MTDNNAPSPELDENMIYTLVGGLALMGAGLVITLQVPQARDFCGRILGHPEVKKAGREATNAIIRRVAASLGWDIEAMLGPLPD